MQITGKDHSSVKLQPGKELEIVIAVIRYNLSISRTILDDIALRDIISLPICLFLASSCSRLLQVLVNVRIDTFLEKYTSYMHCRE